MKAKPFIFILFFFEMLAPAAARAQFPTTQYLRTPSVCMRNFKKLLSTMKQPQYLRMDQLGLETQDYREIVALYSQVLQPCAETDELAGRYQKELKETLQRIDSYCSEHRAKGDVVQWTGGMTVYGRDCASQPQRFPEYAKYLAQLRGEVPRALSDPDYSADLGPIAGEASSRASRAANAPAAAPAAAAPNDPACPGENLEGANIEIAKIAEALEKYNKQVPADTMAATPALQAVLWGTSQEMAVIKKYCHNQAFMERLASLNDAYESALQACRQISSSPDTTCVPVLPDITAFERQMTQPSVSQSSSPASNTSASSPPSGGAPGSKSSCKNGPGRGCTAN